MRDSIIKEFFMDSITKEEPYEGPSITWNRFHAQRMIDNFGVEGAIKKISEMSHIKIKHVRDMMEELKLK